MRDEIKEERAIVDKFKKKLGFDKLHGFDKSLEIQALLKADPDLANLKRPPVNPAEVSENEDNVSEESPGPSLDPD